MPEELVYLAQSDTTAGILCQDPIKLNFIKGREARKAVLMEVDSLQTLKTQNRVPKKFKNLIRRSKKITFIYSNNRSFRVVKDDKHKLFLQNFSSLYSTSANRTGENFDYQKAYEMCDVLVMDSRNIFEGKASKIFRINNYKRKKIR